MRLLLPTTRNPLMSRLLSEAELLKRVSTRCNTADKSRSRFITDDCIRFCLFVCGSRLSRLKKEVADPSLVGKKRAGTEPSNKLSNDELNHLVAHVASFSVQESFPRPNRPFLYCFNVSLR